MNGSQTIHFTYLGDLLGISSLYRASQDNAYNSLNHFYNTVFTYLEPYYKKRGVNVRMFSDSLIVTGPDPVAFIQTMAPIYIKLLSDGLMLRGVMVHGKLENERRVTRKNFQKFLPIDDSLARAAWLEKQVKGCRLIVEDALKAKMRRGGCDTLPLREVELGSRMVCHDVLYPAMVLKSRCDGPWVAGGRDVEQLLTELEGKRDEAGEEHRKHYDDTIKLFSL